MQGSADQAAGNRRASWVRLPALLVALLLYAVPIAVLALSGSDEWLWPGVGWIGWPLVGAVVVLRAPGNRIGWLMLLLGALVSASAWTILAGITDSVPTWLEAVSWALGALAWVLVIVVVVLLPDGRPNGRFGRVLLRALLGLALLIFTLLVFGVPTLADSGRSNPMLVSALQPAAEILAGDSGFAIVPLLLLAVVVDLIAGFRRSDGTLRAQYRWILFGASITVMALIPGLFAEDSPWWTAAIFNAIPVCIGVAVLKYRLFAIDRIVSRTVSYAAVTLVVVATYALVVTSVSRLLPESGALPVAGATLAAAAVALPVLRWVRARVDRRFDRAGFDSLQQVEAFAGRMGGTVDVDDVAADLTGTVQRTLAPAAVGMWQGGAP